MRAPDAGLVGTGSGLGLVHLRHRVELVDGTLATGPVPGGGFRVEASLPAYVATSARVAPAPVTAPEKVVRIVVVDDEPMVCAHLRTILGSAADIEVVGEAHDGAEAIEVVTRERPDVVLMDLRMPGWTGSRRSRHSPPCRSRRRVVALTTFDADEYVLRALRAGAAGFLVKSTPPEDLIGLVRVAADGHTVLSPQAARRLVAASGDREGARDRAHGWWPS